MITTNDLEVFAVKVDNILIQKKQENTCSSQKNCLQIHNTNETHLGKVQIQHVKYKWLALRCIGNSHTHLCSTQSTVTPLAEMVPFAVPLRTVQEATSFKSTRCSMDALLVKQVNAVPKHQRLEPYSITSITTE